MAQIGFTPLQLYRTSTASAVPVAGNLAAGELALNTTDERLYFKNAAGTVKLLASNTGALGTVTSVGGTGTVNGITLTGTVTSSGNLTLGGTLSGVSLTTQVTGTLPVANGGTGITSLGTGVATFLGTPSSANLRAALTDETGTGVAVFGTSPAITTSLTTPSTTFALVNTTATTLNFGGAATTLSIGAATGTLTVNNTTLAAKAITASTTLSVTNGATIQGLTVGLGGGAISSNTAVGLSALGANTTGVDNSALGRGALESNVSGAYNTATGANSLVFNTNGAYNTSNGYQALYNNTTGNFNTANGVSALSGNTTGIENTANGSQALAVNTIGEYNTAIGSNSLYGNTTGNYNTGIGAFSGYNITTGSNNVIIGGYTGAAAPISATGSNWIVLSDGAGNVRQAMDATSVQSLTGAAVVYAPTPASFSGLATLTNTDLQTQIIVATGTSFTLTMPLGSDLNTLVSWAADDLGYDFSVINTASGTITMAGNTGVTIVGRATVATNITGRFRIRRTTASTYIMYRIG
jgi:hypothetical protein